MIKLYRKSIRRPCFRNKVKRMKMMKKFFMVKGFASGIIAIFLAIGSGVADSNHLSAVLVWLSCGLACCTYFSYALYIYFDNLEKMYRQCNAIDEDDILLSSTDNFI